jgi:hypothetical protein
VIVDVTLEVTELPASRMTVPPLLTMALTTVPRSISLPPETLAAESLPPEETISVPPVPITVLEAVAPERMTWLPPDEMSELIAPDPPWETVSTPPLTMVFEVELETVIAVEIVAMGVALGQSCKYGR